MAGSKNDIIRTYNSSIYMHI